jgi:ADP-dependent NAD(P)H-hydrate dehydratase / NAD(P)H-hydrate epimerase
MAFLLTAAQMRAVDAAVISKLGLPGLVLMENAGRGVADIVARERPNLAGLDVRVVCGAGQNGGDGFVIARHLLSRGAHVQVLLGLPPEKIAGDAAVFLNALRALDNDVVLDLSTEKQLDAWRGALVGADVIVDALFGTGLRSDVTGVPAAAITAMNSVDALRVAVDIPSGLDADTGEIRGTAVRAHVTATMAARKLGLVLRADAPVGRVEVVDVGVAIERAVQAALPRGPEFHWLERADVAELLPRRTSTGHKGIAGHVLAIAGSVGKTGAGLLAARAALRAGAGMSTIATTATAQAAFDAKVVAEMTTCYAAGDDADDNSFADLAKQAAKMKAVVIGPGIPTGEGMGALVRRLVTELPVPMVVDADALNLLGAEAADVMRRAVGPRVLTPHPGEMARLRGCSTADIAKDRLGHARELAKESAAVVVLKGARTIVAVADGTAYVNPTANSALGTAGSGDVLAGTIGGLLAQGQGARESACAGVFVHGMAADIATRIVGSQHLMATDLPDAIARACEELRSV